MRCIRILTLSCVLVLSTNAQADTVEIDFDFGNSIMSFLGLVTIPPDGTINSMSATTVLPAIKTAGSATLVQTGSAQLKSLMVDMTINAQLGLFTFLTGTVFVSQVGTSTGPITNTQTVMFGGTGTGTGTGTGSALGMSLYVNAFIDCIGILGCLFAEFPVIITGTNPPPPGQAFTISLAGLNTPGSAIVGGTMPISIPPETTAGSPFTGTVLLTGTEVSRTYYAPEPGSLAQLIPGAVALGGLSRRRRRGRGVSQ